MSGAVILAGMSLCIPMYLLLRVNKSAVQRYMYTVRVNFGCLGMASLILDTPYHDKYLIVGTLDSVILWGGIAITFVEVFFLYHENKIVEISHLYRKAILVLMSLYLIGIALMIAHSYTLLRLNFIAPALLVAFALIPPSGDKILDAVRPLSYFFISILLYYAITHRQGIEVGPTKFFQDRFSKDKNYHNIIWDLFGTKDRFRGYFDSANNCAASISLFGIVLLNRFRKMDLAFYMISIVLLFLTSSRMTIFAFFFASFLIVSTKFSLPGRVRESFDSSNSFVKIFVSFFGLASSCIIFLRFTGFDSTFSGRSNAFAISWNAFVSHPLTGRGILGGASSQVEAAQISFSGVQIIRAENELLMLLDAMGIIGLLFFSFLIYVLLFNQKRKGGGSDYMTGVAISVIAIFGFLTETRLEPLQITPLTFFLVLSFGLRESKREISI